MTLQKLPCKAKKTLAELAERKAQFEAKVYPLLTGQNPALQEGLGSLFTIGTPIKYDRFPSDAHIFMMIAENTQTYNRISAAGAQTLNSFNNTLKRDDIKTLILAGNRSAVVNALASSLAKKYPNYDGTAQKTAKRVLLHLLLLHVQMQGMKLNLKLATRPQRFFEMIWTYN